MFNYCTFTYKLNYLTLLCCAIRTLLFECFTKKATRGRYSKRVGLQLNGFCLGSMSQILAFIKMLKHKAINNKGCCCSKRVYFLRQQWMQFAASRRAALCMEFYHKHLTCWRNGKICVYMMVGNKHVLFEYCSTFTLDQRFMCEAAENTERSTKKTFQIIENGRS